MRLTLDGARLLAVDKIFYVSVHPEIYILMTILNNPNKNKLNSRFAVKHNEQF